MKISVTQEHIDAGTRCSPYACPIANAIRDTIGDVWFVSVTRLEIKIGNSSRIAAPESARSFIDAFDDGQAVQPFEFELEMES